MNSVSNVESAGQIGYNNIESGLTATNVQEAVDEVNSGLTNLNSVLNPDGTVLSFTHTEGGADYVAQFFGSIAPTIIADKVQNNTITASIRLFMNVEGKRIEAGYFDGANWHYQTLVQF